MRPTYISYLFVGYPKDAICKEIAAARLVRCAAQPPCGGAGGMKIVGEGVVTPWHEVRN